MLNAAANEFKAKSSLEQPYLLGGGGVPKSITNRSHVSDVFATQNNWPKPVTTHNPWSAVHFINRSVWL